MINRIKEWDIKNLKINDRQVISLALILSVMALIMAIPSSSNCASANTCTVASTGTFTGNLGIKSNTAFQLTQQHSLAVDQIANWEAVGGNHTGSVIMKDNSGDMNLNGGLRLGTSATSTNGTIRWNGSEVQVYNSGWAGVGGADQNVFTTISGDSGSLTASTTTTSIKIEAAADTNLTVVAAGDKLEIQSAGGGGGSATEFANFYINSNQTFTYSGFSETSVNYDTEYIDTEDCFSTNSTGEITYDSSCNSAYYQVNIKQIINFSGLTNNGAMIQGGNYGSTSSRNQYRTWVTLFNTPNYTLSTNDIVCFDAGETWKLMFYHGQNYSTGSAIWLSGNQQSSLSFIKLKDKGSSC